MAIPARHRRLILGLLAVTVAMFAFGFLLVPLYDVFCKVTGLNGKIGPGVARAAPVDLSRRVKVQLIALRANGLHPTIEPETPVFELHPGQVQETAFIAHNPDGETRVIRAVPSIAPAEAAQYLNKINCFCFHEQQLKAGEQRRMPLVFTIDPGLPAYLKTLTLSYTLFDITAESDAGGAKL